MRKVRIAVANDAVAQGAWIDPVANELGCELVYGPVATKEEVALLTQGCEGLIISLQKMSPEHIAGLAPSIKIIGRLGVGLDNINLDATKENKIAVVYQPLYAMNEVSNHAIAMLLSLHRGLPGGNAAIREKNWGAASESGHIHSLQDSTVGVIGCGRIGKEVIRKLQPFVKKVIGFDPAISGNIEGAEMVTDLDQLLEQSQMVTLHAPYLPSTHHIIDAPQLAKMPKRSILINVSRGGLVNEDALTAALKSGHISAAGLDVFQTEPLAADSPLRSAPNLILTPHIAWYSQSAAPRLVGWTLRDVFSYLQSKTITHGALASGPF